MTIKNKIVDHQLFKQAKIALLFLAFMCVGAYAEAQNFQSTSSYLNGSSPQTVEQTVAASPQQAYKSTIYEPFSSATPSSDANGSNNGNARGMSGRRNAFVDPGETGAEEYPIGEPWIMLAFAAMAAVVITLRKKQTA